jgi:hypothetical protein
MSRFSEAVRETRDRQVKDAKKTLDLVNEAPADAETVVFYAWTDAGSQSQPSSLTMRISGGQRVRDPQSGAIAALGYHEVRFNMGIFRTKDEAEIAGIRKAIKDGDTITEDKELYLSKVQSPAMRAERLARRTAEDRENLKKKDDEIADLRAKLALVGHPGAPD